MHGRDAPKYESIRDYLRVLRAHRLLITVVALAFGAAGFVLAMVQNPVYATQAAIALTTSAAEADLLGGTDEGSVPQPGVSAQLVEQQSVASAAAAKVDKKNIKANDVLEATTASVEEGTTQIIIEAQWNDGPIAAKLANAMAGEVVAALTREERQRFRSASNQLRREVGNVSDAETSADILTQQQLARLEALSKLVRPAEVTQPAVTPSGPISPNPVRNTLLGVVLGLALGIGAAFLRDSLDRRLRDSREMEEHLDIPLLGQVDADALGHTAFSSNGSEPLDRPDIEAFHILRTNLELSRRDQPPRVFAVASGLPEEGKSTVSAGLATAWAAAGKRTVLVECDLRRPSLASRAGLRSSPGIVDYYVGDASLEEVVQAVSLERPPATTFRSPPAEKGAPLEGETEVVAAERSNLACVTAGRQTRTVAELLGSQRFKDFMFELIADHDIVVLDTSPVLSVADTRELLPVVDYVLLCVRASQTTREEATAAVQALSASSLPIALIATGLSQKDEFYYGYQSYSSAFEA